jgi:hypothetical protein
MRIIIVCGDPDCSEEYYADSEDRLWTCPHCGREKENPYYPFLTVRLMHAKTAPDDADWKELHDELLLRARRRLAELTDREGFLTQEVARLRGRLPEGKLVPPSEPPDDGGVAGFLAGWAPSGPEGDGGSWRALHDELLEGARAEVLLLEARVPKLEDEVRRLKSALGVG